MTWLNLLPRELEPGDDWDDRIFDHLEEPVDRPELERINCRLVFRDGSVRLWHTEAPMRIYRGRRE